MTVDITSAPLTALEDMVVASVGVTARAVALVAPDVTLLQWRLVVVLGGVPDGVTVSELAGHLGSRLPATSRLLGRLRARGLVRTRKHAADARVSVVELTPAGRDMWEDVRDRRRDDLRDALALADLSPGEADVLERVARRLVAFG
jgi:DNA-binding MarR family transcriptional regulator